MGGEWSFKISGSRKILVSQSRFLAVMCVSQSRFLYEGVSESRFFCNAKDLEVPVGLFSFLNDVFSSLGGEFH